MLVCVRLHFSFPKLHFKQHAIRFQGDSIHLLFPLFDIDPFLIHFENGRLVRHIDQLTQSDRFYLLNLFGFLCPNLPQTQHPNLHSNRTCLSPNYEWWTTKDNLSIWVLIASGALFDLVIATWINLSSFFIKKYFFYDFDLRLVHSLNIHYLHSSFSSGKVAKEDYFGFHLSLD